MISETVPVPLPLTWRMYVTVHCPSCGVDMHFRAKTGSLEREVYCPDDACPQSRYVYTIVLSLDGCEVKAVRSR